MWGSILWTQLVAFSAVYLSIQEHVPPIHLAYSDPVPCSLLQLHFVFGKTKTLKVHFYLGICIYKSKTAQLHKTDALR